MFGELCNALQQAIIVEPVVITSSISSIVLSAKSVLSRRANISFTFSTRSVRDFCVCDSLLRVRYTFVVFSGTPSCRATSAAISSDWL